MHPKLIEVVRIYRALEAEDEKAWMKSVMNGENHERNRDHAHIHMNQALFQCLGQIIARSPFEIGTPQHDSVLRKNKRLFRLFVDKERRITLPEEMEYRNGLKEFFSKNAI